MEFSNYEFWILESRIQNLSNFQISNVRICILHFVQLMSKIFNSNFTNYTGNPTYNDIGVMYFSPLQTWIRRNWANIHRFMSNLCTNLFYFIPDSGENSIFLKSGVRSFLLIRPTFCQTSCSFMRSSLFYKCSLFFHQLFSFGRFYQYRHLSKFAANKIYTLQNRIFPF